MGVIEDSVGWAVAKAAGVCPTGWHRVGRRKIWSISAFEDLCEGGRRSQESDVKERTASHGAR